jgi:site-specific recombinase XerD
MNQVRAKEDELRQFIRDVELRGELCTLDQLERYRDMGSRPCKTFTEFMEVQAAKEDVKRSTAENYRQALMYLRQYRGEVRFSEIQKVSVLRGFVNWLGNDTDLSHNTRQKHYKFVCKFIGLAIIEGYIKRKDDPRSSVNMAPRSTERLFLEPEELVAFETMAIPEGKEHWQPYLDGFLFSCYTGLRLGDIMALHPGNFSHTEQGIILELTNQKTGKPYRQNLAKLFPKADSKLSRPEIIADRYLQLRPDAEQNMIVGSSRQLFRRTLKLIAHRLPVREIVKKKISPHVARHTCATELIRLGVSVIAVNKLLRHSNIKETMIYVHLTNKALDQELDSIEWS